MPANIIDTSLFTDPIVVFSDGDLAGGPGLDDPIQGLANRTRFLNNLIAVEETARAALRADCDDDYNAGQWLTKTGYEALIDAGTPAGWSTVGGGGIYTTNGGTTDTITVNFALPWYSTPLEIAMWGVQSGSPSTRAGLSATLFQTGMTPESIARVNFAAEGDYLQKLLTSGHTWYGNKGVVQVVVHGPNLASGFQLHGVGVRFKYANRSV